MLTDKQIRIEKKIQEIAETLSPREAEQQIIDILKMAKRSGDFTKEDIRNYNYRKDDRTNVEFIKHLRKTHIEEHKTFLYFYNYMVEYRKTKVVSWESYGSDIDGYIMIANFKERSERPSNPDYKLTIGDKFNLIEAKNFYKEHWFKVTNLKKYKEKEAWIIVGSEGKYYLYSKKAVNMLLSMKRKAIKIHGKPSIVITKNKINNSHFILEELMEKKLVKEIVNEEKT